jgi:hypothetical protein
MPPKSYAKIARSAPAPSRVPMTESELSRVLAEVHTSWGEIACVGDPLPVQRRRSPLAAPAPAPVLRADWTDFYAQPWAEKVELRGSDYLDLSDLTEDEYEAAMSWIYAMGWSVSTYENGMADETRLWVVCQPDTLPPRVWVRPNRFEGAAQLLAETAPVPVPVAVARARIVIPRFCRVGPDCPLKDTTCNFCHADTLACKDEACTFGEKCSAEKRLTCIRTHPGDPHYEGKCIHAPWAAERAAKAAAEAEAAAERLLAQPDSRPAGTAEAAAESEARAAVERARAAALVEAVPEPQADGPSWDDEDYVTPEVTVVSVTPEELEREAWNKGHRRAQTA